MDSLNGDKNLSTNVNPFAVLANNDKSYLIERFSNNIWNFLPDVTPKENIFAKQNDLSQEIAKVEAKSEYFRKALEGNSSQNLNFIG